MEPEEQPDDNPDAELELRVAELKAIVARKKREYTRALTSGAKAPASELSAIAKLEVQITNLEAYLRLRALHRERRAAPPGFAW